MFFQWHKDVEVLHGVVVRFRVASAGFKEWGKALFKLNGFSYVSIQGIGLSSAPFPGLKKPGIPSIVFMVFSNISLYLSAVASGYVT